MSETILIDSISFGIPESENLHPAEGCFAQNHDVVQCQYGGEQHISENEGPVHHWRDWAEWVAVELEVLAEYGNCPLVLSFTLRAYMVESPPSSPVPTIVQVQADDQTQEEEPLLIADDGRWNTIEVDIPAGSKGSPRKIRLHLDDRGNVYEDGSHYGKSITHVRLYALTGNNPEGMG